jgi:uncharacterized protein
MTGQKRESRSPERVPSDAGRVADLLRHTKVEVAAESYLLVGVDHRDWARLLENPELAPSGDSPFMVLKDEREVTLLLTESDWQKMKHAIRDARVEKGFRLVTLDADLDWEVSGYLARVSGVLASARIPIGAFSAYSRDHLLIKQDRLAEALRLLGEEVEALC